MSSHAPSNSKISAQDRADDITFAIELKFLIRQNLNEITPRYGNIRPFVPHLPVELQASMTRSETRLQRDNWEAVARAIDAVPGVNATTSHEVKAQSLGHTDYWKSHWLVYKANSATPMYLTYIQGDPNRPLLNETDPDFNKYVWTPVEVCSPILLWDQKEEVISMLSQILDTINRQFDVVSNASTETHVHMGRVDGKFYTLKTMKKLATLFWLSEPLLRALKDPTSPNYNHHYTWSYPWRENSRIALALKRQLPEGQTIDDLYTGTACDFDSFLGKLNDTRVTALEESCVSLDGHREALRAIWRAADHKELAYIIRGPERKLRRLGFNFYALEQKEDDEGPRTIEFRFLEGFIDKTIIPAWVRLCGQLVDLVMEQPEDGKFYDVVALLLNMPKNWSLDTQFAAVMSEMGSGRVPVTVSESLRAVIRNNYPPSDECEDARSR